ncbi:MAG: hypothetical protein JST75_09265 [Bacteroidetes bacterium]|nr:hypothetical protein [Bacteroidota bacterium]
MRYGYTDEGQLIFNSFINAIAIIAKGFIKLLVISPFIYTAYIISQSILSMHDNALLWIAVVSIFSWILYVFFFELKKWMAILKSKKNYVWILFFVVCVGFACVIPAWIIYEPVKFFVLKMTGIKNATIISVIISLSFGYFIYRRNRFF